MNTDNDIDFYFLQLATSVDAQHVQKWIAECATVIAGMGGVSLIPGRIGRSEPYLRRAGGQIIDEPLDEDKRSGANKRILALAEEHAVSGIIVHDPELLDLGLQVKQVQNCPLYFIVQEAFPLGGYLAKRSLLKKATQIDAFICVSNYIANYVHHELKIEDERIQIIYEGFDLETISSQQVSQERTMSLAHSWGAVENVAELVLVPAVFNDSVWCDNLIQFAKELSENSHSDIRYVVVGDDDGSRAMQRVENQLIKIAPSKIQLVGHCADIEAAIKLTSTVLYFYSQTRSQFSDALIAQALGRFVFLPQDCPAAEEFIHVGKSGRLLPSDPMVIRESLEAFIRDEHDVREGNFVASRSFIMQYFSRETMHARLRHVFKLEK